MECARKARIKMAPPCRQCGKPISRAHLKRNIYCSHACYAAASRRVDRTYTCQVCGKISTTISGFAAKRRKYCSPECAGIARRSDVQQLNELIRHSPLLDIWARKVQERDGGVCQDCGTTERLHSHHIETVFSLLQRILDVSNGVTVCLDCHLERHRGQFGRSNIDAVSDALSERLTATPTD